MSQGAMLLTRREFARLAGAIGVSVFSCLALPGCTSQRASQGTSSSSLDLSDWSSIVDAARGSTARFYGWGGNADNNEWIDSVLGATLKDSYGITLQRVPMDIEDVLTLLSSEIQAGAESSIDMIWINGENFYSAKQYGYLYGPFAESLPNFQQYVDADSNEVNFDYGFETAGYESPYGKCQFVFINDSALTPEKPSNAQELLAYAQKYPGKVTYPAPPMFTGRTFVINIIYDLLGYEQFVDMEADKSLLRKAIAPALEYLRELNPYLWNKGKSFPATQGEQDAMFADGELVLTMDCYPYVIAANIAKGVFPKTAVSFQFKGGTTADLDFIAIPNNSPHKQAALVAINEVLSPAMQLSRYEQAKICPVLDLNMLSDADRALFKNAEIGAGIVPLEELNANQLPQMSSKLISLVEEIWLEEVPGM